jgi:7,8-dihydroneopterin aldolase/epimerase/oxygenase
MDKIILEGIQFHVKVGTTEQERSLAQPCGLDLTLETDLRRAGTSGDLRSGVDYVAVFNCVQKVCTNNTFTLLEEVGHQVCREILETFPVGEVKLRLRKLRPFTDKLRSVGIEIKRKRKELKNENH